MTKSTPTAYLLKKKKRLGCNQPIPERDVKPSHRILATSHDSLAVVRFNLEDTSSLVCEPFPSTHPQIIIIGLEISISSIIPMQDLNPHEMATWANLKAGKSTIQIINITSQTVRVKKKEPARSRQRREPGYNFITDVFLVNAECCI